MSVSSLLDVYERDNCGAKSIVVKNLQDDVCKENLEMYLEVICPQELADVYFPMKGCNIAIALFKTDVEDIKMCQSNASRRGFRSAHLQLELLGKPAGICIANLTEVFSDEFLILYFESKRSGGVEGTVERVELLDVGGTKYATILITSEHAITSILSKQLHQLRKSVVHLEPFYPSVHKCIVDSLNNETLHKDKGIPLAAGSRTRCKPTIPLRTVAHTDHQDTCSREVKPTLTRNYNNSHSYETNQSSENYANYDKEPKLTGRASHRLPDEKPIFSQNHTYSSACGTGRPRKQPVFNANAGQTDRQDVNRGTVAPRQQQINTRPTHTSMDRQSATCEYPTNNAKNEFKLKIFSDDPLDTDIMDPGRGQSSAETVVEYSLADGSKPPPMSQAVGDNVRNKSNRNVASVKPNPRNMQIQTSSDSGDGNKRTRRRHNRPSKSEDKHSEKQQTLSYEDEVSVSPAKIVTLIMFRFQQKYQTDNMKVMFKEKDGKVIIKGSADEDIQQARLILLECLDKIVCKTEPLSCMKSRFLSREQCRQCLRTRCIKQKVRATFEVDDSKRILHSYAFSAGDAERGLQFVGEEITVIKIQLLEGQTQLLDGDTWKTLIELLDKSITTVYLEEANCTILVIESFIESKAKEAKSKVIQHFKQHVPKVAANVTLESAKAMCFQKCFADDLRRDIERRCGTFDIRENNKSPLKLQIFVEGDAALADNLTKVIGQIWHEYVDLGKLSNKGEDKWLMLKGIASFAGNKFFRSFEHLHNCFIDVSNDGEFSIPQSRLTLSEVQIPPDLDGSGDEPKTVPTAFAAKYELAESDVIIYDRDDRLIDLDYRSQLEQDDVALCTTMKYMERKHRYQGGMSENEALVQAMKLSMEHPGDDIGDYDVPVTQMHPCSPFRETDDRGYDNHFLQESAEFHDVDVSQQNVAMVIGQRARQLSHISSGLRPAPVRKHVLPAPVPTRTTCIRMVQTTVNLVQGEIVQQQADALVNIVSPSHTLMESVVSKAFVKCGGQQIIQMYDAARGSGSGIVVETGGCGRLKCSSVFHVVLQKGDKYCQKMINQTISEVFNQCVASRYTSVAFPPLGVGRMYRYLPETVAERMLSEMYLLLQTPRYRMQQITIVIFDDATYGVFDKAFQSFDASSISRYTPVPARRSYMQDPFQQNVQSPLSAPNQFLQIRPQQQLLTGLQALQQRPIDTSQQKPRPAVRGHTGHHRASSGSTGSGYRRSSTGSPRASTGSPQASTGSPRVTEGRLTHHRMYKGAQETDIRYSERPRTKTRMPPLSRFPKKKPASSLKIVVFAENKEICVRARHELCKKIKEEFLYEETIDKIKKISNDAKDKIVKIVISNGVESVKERNMYVLKGHIESVRKARTDILQVLLNEKDSVEVRRRRPANVRRETKEFVKFMAEEEPEVPPYWKNYKPDVTLKSLMTSVKHVITQQKYEKIELDKNSYEFSTIVKMINSTFDQSKIGKGQDAVGLDAFNYSKLFVVKVQRIENLELYEQFTRKRQMMYLRLLNSKEVGFPNIRNLPNCTGAIETTRFVNSVLDKDIHPELNEFLLFHGTKNTNVGIICNDGLDNRLGSGRAMFGSGIYGAECSIKADQYADDKTSRSAGKGSTKKMFLIRMVLGNSYLCNDQNPHKYRRPPCTACFQDDCIHTSHAGHKFGHFFDSVIGDNGKLFREFVVYDAALCYPEYLITYERH